MIPRLGSESTSRCRKVSSDNRFPDLSCLRAEVFCPTKCSTKRVVRRFLVLPSVGIDPDQVVHRCAPLSGENVASTFTRLRSEVRVL